MKIENKPIAFNRRQPRDGSWGAYLAAVKQLKVGQSFVCPTAGSSNYRLAASIAKEWLGINLAIVREGDSWRVGRIA